MRTVLIVGLLSLLVPFATSARKSSGALVAIDNDDIGGLVTSSKGPEAGVWVIAETTDLPTRFAKIVVTDDRGRYLLPELPKANYTVWVRGYGLVDSQKVQATPGKTLDLTAVPAPNAAAAAEYYPAIYWYSMLKIPATTEFPIGNVRTQLHWMDVVKTNGCYGCHALGNKATRTIPPQLGEFKNSEEAWTRRIQSGQAMMQMAAAISRVDTEKAIKLFAD